jgi:hypothetical protein
MKTIYDLLNVIFDGVDRLPEQVREAIITDYQKKVGPLN